MTPTELLAALQGRGIKLRRIGDKLRFGPRGLVTPDLAALLTEHKKRLLVLLAEEPSGRVASVADAAAEAQEPTVGIDDEPLMSEHWPADGWPDVETVPIDEVQPCANCRRINHWQDGLGNWKCRRCQPPNWSGRALWNTAERLRSARHKKSSMRTLASPCESR